MTNDPIPPVETIEPAQWEPRDQPLLDAFVDFHRLANCVVTRAGPLQGWFGEAHSRTDVYLPFNGRVMENHWALAFFAGCDAPWNRYYGHAGVVGRLHLALDYLYALMDEKTGAIPEYAPVALDEPMLAPSSFGAEYLSLTLEIAGHLLAPAARDRLVRHATRAAAFALTDEACYRHATSFTNQILGALTAAARLARLTGDGSLRALVEKRGAALVGDFLAPMGFLYEANGAETFAYFYTTLGRLIPLYAEWPDERVQTVLKRHGAWMSRWMLPEPNSNILVASTSHETRTRSGYRIVPRPFPGIGPLLAGGEKDERRFVSLLLPAQSAQAAREQAWRETSGDDLVQASRARRAGAPYGTLSNLARKEPYAADAAAQDRARQSLPFLANTSFVQNETDERGNQYVFVRHPGYYAGFSLATHRTLAFHGPAFVWAENRGTILLSQNGGRAGWETLVGAERTGAQLGLAALRLAGDGHEVTLDYRAAGLGIQKTYSLHPNVINVRFLTSGLNGRSLVERVPLLLRDQGDVIHCDYGRCTAVHAKFGAVTRYVTIERRGTPLLRFDLGAPVLVGFDPTVDPDGFVRTEMLFPLSATQVRRAGYQIEIGDG